MAIESEIQFYPSSPLARLDAQPGLGAYAIKYLPARYAGDYRATGRPLRISRTPGFTWGAATYVSHISNPLSTAIFGRGGVVARYRPYGWRVFDATARRAQRLYMEWAKVQRSYRWLMLTAHANWYNSLLRESFRRDFGIDCVLFHPDQWNHHYTRRYDDIWMAVSDFDSNGELTGMEWSDQFHEARLTVVIAEEFDPADPQVRMRLEALLGPVGPSPAGSSTAVTIADAYRAARLHYIEL